MSCKYVTVSRVSWLAVDTTESLLGSQKTQTLQLSPAACCPRQLAPGTLMHLACSSAGRHRSVHQPSDEEKLGLYRSLQCPSMLTVGICRSHKAQQQMRCLCIAMCSSNAHSLPRTEKDLLRLHKKSKLLCTTVVLSATGTRLHWTATPTVCLHASC